MIDRRLAFRADSNRVHPPATQTCFSSPAEKSSREGTVQSAQVQPLLRHRISSSRSLVDCLATGNSARACCTTLKKACRLIPENRLPQVPSRCPHSHSHTGKNRDRQGVCGESRLRVVLGQHGDMEAMVIPVRTVSPPKGLPLHKRGIEGIIEARSRRARSLVECDIANNLAWNLGFSPKAQIDCPISEL